MCASTRSEGVHSNSVTELEYERADPEHFLVELSGDGGCEFRLAETLRRGDGTTVEFFITRGCTLDAIRERVPDDTAVGVVSEEPDRVVFQVARPGRCVTETVERAGAIPVSVTASDGTVRLVLDVPPDVDPRGVIDAMLENHPDWTFIARRSSEHATPAFTPCGVQQVLRKRTTDRQWEVLRTAYRNGYFERPREHTGEEIADALDISSATFSQHLRSALDNLLSAVVEDRPFEDRG